MTKHIKIMRKCNQFYRDGLFEAVACVKDTSFICIGNAGAEMYLAKLCKTQGLCETAS
jgi:hypothetical protein